MPSSDTVYGILLDRIPGVKDYRWAAPRQRGRAALGAGCDQIVFFRRVLKNLLSPRLLKKVQMPGGARRAE